MDISVKISQAEKQKTPCLLVGIYEKNKLSESAEAINNLTQGGLRTIIKQGDIDGKAGQTQLIPLLPGAPCTRLLLVGLGSTKAVKEADFRKACEAAAKILTTGGMESAVSFLSEVNVHKKDVLWKIKTEATSMLAATYQYNPYKSKNEPNKHPLRKLTLGIGSRAHLTLAKEGLAQAIAINTGITLTKDLGNCPPNICHPTYLAEQALQLGNRFDKLNVDVLEEADMKKLGMGALLSVSKGSQQPAKLITMQYTGGKKSQKPVVLVGKGVTFDTGGISLKPGASMDEMKFDMCGAASVFGTLLACCELGLPINLVGIIPAVENMPDGKATRPGDIVTTMSKQTVEILNTDAEGRLILCDALTYAEKFNPDVVVDIATLTGACIVALGKHTSGLLSNDNSLANALFDAGQRSGDKCWRLPLWDEYQKQLDSNFADMANIGGAPAGTITAACFLSRFTEDYRWAHLDIAGVAWLSGDKKGATGRPVPLLMDYLLQRCQ